MKNLYLSLLFFTLLSCNQENKSDNLDGMLKTSCDYSFSSYQKLLVYGISHKYEKNNVNPFLIRWDFASENDQYKNFVNKIINKNKEDAQLIKDIHLSKEIYNKLNTIKQEAPSLSVKKELEDMIDKVVAESQKYNPTKTNKSTYLLSFHAGVLFELVKYYQFFTSLYGYRSIYDKHEYIVLRNLFFPILESDKSVLSISLFRKIGALDLLAGTGVGTPLKDIVESLVNELGTDAIPYIFRIRFSYNAVTDDDVKELREYIKNNPKNCDAKFIYAAHELQYALFNQDEVRWINAAKYMQNIAKEHFCKDAIYINDRIINRSFIKFNF